MIFYDNEPMCSKKIIMLYNLIVCSAQPKVNVGVAKRLVRGALWEQKPQKRPREEGARPPSSKRPSS